MRLLDACAARPANATWRAMSLALVVALAGLAVVWCAPLARGQSGETNIVTIEEDWELLVGEPDPVSLSPQATCVFSPLGDAEVLYAALDINHHSQPEFAGGGLQLQVWENDEVVATAESNSAGKLQQNDETVTWTQRMHVADGDLTFAIVNGQSESWGGFGDNGALTITVGSPLTNLNSYNPDVSVQNSGVGFAANRVKLLVLKRVRATTSAGDVIEDNTERVVYERD